MIILKNLSKTFTDKQGSTEVLKNINLDIFDGEILGVIGLSGAGKSTLIRCINKLEEPTSGEVIFNGKNISKLKQKELNKVRQSVAMIFQSFNLFEQSSILKNVCFPLEISGVKKSEAKRKASELLKLVGLSDKAQEYPSKLSGGQKQRVAIARALSTNPDVLLCDEATSSLDPETTSSILELLKSVNKSLGVTVVIVTHEMSVIEKICDRVAVLDKGNIVELSDVKEIFKNPKSKTAKNFILTKSIIKDNFSKRCLRIVFDGYSANEPMLSELILHCQVFVNILHASTKVIDGKVFGEMLLQLPDDELLIERIFTYLNEKPVFYSEEELSYVATID